MLLPEIIAAINMAFAFLSCFILVWSVPKIGRPLNIVLAVAACLAFIYGASFIWLLMNFSQAATWSATMRWFGLLTWPVVWMAPALAMVKYKSIAGAMIRKASRPDNVITPIAGLDAQEILNRDDYHG